jgi:hypothetical protein
MIMAQIKLMTSIKTPWGQIEKNKSMEVQKSRNAILQLPIWQ